jgi:hypothetical protein
MDFTTEAAEVSIFDGRLTIETLENQPANQNGGTVNNRP